VLAQHLKLDAAVGQLPPHDHRAGEVVGQASPHRPPVGCVDFQVLRKQLLDVGRTWGSINSAQSWTLARHADLQGQGGVPRRCSGISLEGEGAAAVVRSLLAWGSSVCGLLAVAAASAQTTAGRFGSDALRRGRLVLPVYRVNSARLGSEPDGRLIVPPAGGALGAGGLAATRGDTDALWLPAIGSWGSAGWC
jgi:hypothetical protein